MRLAGLRINPEINISSREVYYHKLSILEIETGIEHAIDGLPQDQKFCRLCWNYNQDKAAVLNITRQGVEVWFIDVVNHKARLLTSPIVNGNIGTSVMWLQDNSLLISHVVKDMGPLKNKKDEIPTGPVIAENSGKNVENRTFQDLLKDEIDAYNFERITSSEIWRYDLNGNKSLWKSSAMHDGMSLSPDGNYILLSEIKRPFSYFVQFDRFPYSTFIYHIDGRLFETVVESPLLEYMPQGFMAVQKGMRQIKWRADHPHTLFWVEALDEGDPEKEVPFRDALFEKDILSTEEEPRLLYKTQLRFAGIFFGNSNLALVYERWWSNRKLKTLLIDLSQQKEALLFDERNFQDKYNDPGNFIMKKNQFGWNVLHIEDDGTMYLNGDGYTMDGRHPFIDSYNHKTGVKQRLFEANVSERQEDIAAVIDIKKGKILTIIQSQFEYPLFYIRNIYSGELNKIRNFENPFRLLDGVQKEILTYKRSDGVDLNANLYLPAGYEKGQGQLPLIMWAYPTEYKDKATAGQKTSVVNDFIYPYWGSPLYWVCRGYAILDNVSFPILGENNNHPNDNFISQLVENARAAIEEVVNMGIADRHRVAIGGHSYGAYMVAMLLTHSDLFAAGIARSGAYNRTLTPFGFQSEERNYWQAKEVYNSMNPFLDAEKVKTPLLLIHGEADNNSGTHTMQTERYFAALKAMGCDCKNGHSAS